MNHTFITDTPCESCGVLLDENGYCDTCDALCEHGMSAWLCMGPNHYPSREQEMEGRYF